MEYKNYTIKLKDFLNEKETLILTEFNKSVNKNDLYIDFKNDQIQLFLRQADIHLLKERKKILSKKFHINELASPINPIIEKIESIGSYGIKGKKRNFVDYNKERKVSDRKKKIADRNKLFYTEDHKFSQKDNQCPHKFLNKIICADSENFLKSLPDNCIDLILTSPPYNFGLKYENNYDSIHWEKYFEKIKDIFRECIRVLKWGGRLVLNVQPLYSDYIPTHHIFSNFFMEKKMIWKGEILWEKNNYNCKYTAWGSWKSPSSPYLKYTWEFLEIFSKGDLKKKGDSSKIDISGDEFKKWVVAKWSIAPERKMKKYNHPAMFPEELASRVLKLFSFKDDIILDPFNGVGTTTFMAKKLGRKYIGIDISEEYCRTAENRNKDI